MKSQGKTQRQQKKRIDLLFGKFPLKHPIEQNGKNGIDRQTVGSQSHQKIRFRERNAASFFGDMEGMHFSSHRPRSQRMGEFVSENIGAHGSAEKILKDKVKNRSQKEQAQRTLVQFGLKKSQWQVVEGSQRQGKKQKPEDEFIESANNG